MANPPDRTHTTKDSSAASSSAPSQAGASTRAPSVPSGDVSSALKAGQDYLLGQQNDDGHWRAELEGGSILESEYIFAKYFVGERPETHPKLRKAAECLRQQQLDDGGWGTFPSDSTDVSASAEAYFVLKLIGDDPEARSREA